MEEQRIFLDEDNKLVVKSNNGILHADGTANIDIKGEFLIDAKEVAKLFGIVNDKEIAYVYKDDLITNWYYRSRAFSLCILSKSDVNSILDEAKKDVEEYKAENNKLIKQNHALVKALIENRVSFCDCDNDTLDAIKEFNKNRRWCEREIIVY